MLFKTQKELNDLPLIWTKNTSQINSLLPIVFFDRDDTLIIDCGHSNEIHEFAWTPQAIEVLSELKGLPIQIGIATNQAGLSNGKFSLEKLTEFTEYFMRQIETIVGDMSIIVLACPHNLQVDCNCRKPKPGLFQYLQNLNLGDPLVFFGNAQSDVIAANVFGIQGVLITESNFALSVRSWIRSNL
jgi:D-glycero-D-manno-heptose 1,7-bisphosphate phosphatase